MFLLWFPRQNHYGCTTNNNNFNPSADEEGTVIQWSDSLLMNSHSPMHEVVTCSNLLIYGIIQTIRHSDSTLNRSTHNRYLLKRNRQVAGILIVSFQATPAIHPLNHFWQWKLQGWLIFIVIVTGGVALPQHSNSLLWVPVHIIEGWCLLTVWINETITLFYTLGHVILKKLSCTSWE